MPPAESSTSLSQSARGELADLAARTSPFEKLLPPPEPARDPDGKDDPLRLLLDTLDPLNSPLTSFAVRIARLEHPECCLQCPLAPAVRAARRRIARKAVPRA